MEHNKNKVKTIQAITIDAVLNTLKLHRCGLKISVLENAALWLGSGA